MAKPQKNLPARAVLTPGGLARSRGSVGRAQHPGMLPQCRVGNSLLSLQHPAPPPPIPEKAAYSSPASGWHVHRCPCLSPPRLLPCPDGHGHPLTPVPLPRLHPTCRLNPSPAGATIPREGTGGEFLFQHLLIAGRCGLAHAPSPVWVPSLFPGTHGCCKSQPGSPALPSSRRGGPGGGRDAKGPW